MKLMLPRCCGGKIYGVPQTGVDGWVRHCDGVLIWHGRVTDAPLSHNHLQSRERINADSIHALTTADPSPLTTAGQPVMRQRPKNIIAQY